MTHTTLYLKYRPQRLSELDSTEPREELIKIFKSEKFPHAFLFTGPKGIGKTSAARIVAKTVNCKKPKNLEPCNECANCISITNGTNVDVLEIDAASNRGIDDIKELREKIKLAPSSLKYKVYIIDEVHMLTTEAFNALLKTLEEPPKHAIFVLCTTDPEKLPKTITSRCLIINFKKATKSEIVGKLKKVCEEEKWEYEEEALGEIAKLSEGSFRDANKILEQVSFSGKILSAEVKKLSGISADFNIEEFLLILQKKQAREAILWINKKFEQGVNLKVLIEKLLDTSRNILLTNFGIEEVKLENKFNFSQEELECLIGLFTRAYGELRFAVIAQLPLEMAVIEWSSFAKATDDKADEFKKIKEPEDDEKKAGRKAEKETDREEKKEEKIEVKSESNFSLNDVIAKWPAILEKVKPLNHSVLAFLKATRPLNCEDGFLVLEVFYKFHKDQLEKDQCRKIFEKAASEVLGCDVKLKCNLSETKREAVPMPKVEAIAGSQTNDNADIIKLAEEIFNKGGTIQ